MITKQYEEKEFKKMHAYTPPIIMGNCPKCGYEICAHVIATRPPIVDSYNCPVCYSKFDKDGKSMDVPAQ